MGLFSGPYPLIGPNGRNWARIVLPAQWALCGLGIGVEMGYHSNRKKEGSWVKKLSLVLYVLMVRAGGGGVRVEPSVVSRGGGSSGAKCGQGEGLSVSLASPL